MKLWNKNNNNNIYEYLDTDWRNVRYFIFNHCFRDDFVLGIGKKEYW